MSGKLSVTLPGSSTNKLSVASSSGRKRCSLACGTEKRGSVGGRSGSEDSVYEYEGPEFIIHKEDFLIHNKKVSVRSRSSDCYCSAKSSMESTPTLPRRSSSSSATGVTRLFSSNNRASKLRAERVSSTGSEGSALSSGSRLSYAKNPHRSLERLSGKGRAAYVGSHSTSSLPRKREEAMRRDSTETTTTTSSSRKSSAELESRKSSKEEVEVVRRSSKEEVSRKTKGSLDDAGSLPSAPSSLFSFLTSGAPTSERRRQSMVKGESTESLDRREVARVRRQSPSPLPKQKPLLAGRLSGGKEATKMPGVKKGATESGNGKEKKVATTTAKKAATTDMSSKRVVRASSTAPVRSSTLPRNTKVAAGSSVTAPIIRRPLSQATSSPTTTSKRRETGQAAVIATDSRNKTTIKITKSCPATKKVSFEYNGGGEVKVQEGLAMADYNNPVMKRGLGLLGASGRSSGKHGGSDLSLNRRGRGGVGEVEGGRGSTPSLVRRGATPQSGQEELAATWLQLKEDIETAMGRKPEMGAGQYKDLQMMLQAKSEDQLSHEKAWLEAENVWLVHRDGFAAGRQIKESEAGEPLTEGKVRVKLDCNDEVIEVDEDDVEKANPPSFDRVEDLAQLRYLNESSVLHTLRQRYGNNLIHTYAGPSMITINPCHPLAIYSEKIVQMFKGCKLEDMPPHIYSAGQMAYRTLMSTKKDQSIAFIGRSGSGKSTNFRHVLSYLTQVAGSVNNILTVGRLNAINSLLEAFGNTRTIMNANATRFSQIFSIDFDHSGVIASASVQVLMLEKTRVVRRPEGEPNFNIFYQMLAGLDTRTKRDMQLDNLSEPNMFMTPLQRSEDKAAAAQAFARLGQAAEQLEITHAELRALWSVLAAVYHLGTAGVGKSNLGRAGFARPPSAQKAAHCLGISVEELSRAIFQGSVSSGTLNRTRHKNDANAVADGLEALEGFVVGLYSEVFTVLLSLINRAIASPAHTAASIIVVDTPGFQNPATCGRPAGATFEELCHNYGQERLQLMFHDKTITALKERYESEQIEVPDLEDLTEICTPQPLIRLIDKQSMARASQSDLHQTDKRGLLWLLDEEAIFPGASDESFVERLMLQYGDRTGDDLIKKGPGENNFILQHFQGTNPVLYNASGWLKASRESPISKMAVQLLHESADKGLADLFLKYRSGVNTTMSGSIVGVEGSQSLRRASSIRRAFTSGTAGIKRHSAALQVKFQIDGLMEQLRRTRIKFVHCFLPQHTAGLCDVAGPGSPNGNKSEQVTMNVPLIRSQLRGAQILDAVRLHKIGFPESLGYGDFWRRFSLLSSGGHSPGAGEEKGAVEAMLVSLDLDHTSYRLGNTQIFLRGGVLSNLEEERYARLGDKIVNLQALARGYLCRKRAAKLKTQDIAIRCIQKNVRKFMGVRGWPWWRLLIKVTPLLNVHRTEEQLKAKNDEVEALKNRLEKAERERAELKETVEKQESRLSELSADLSEEHSAAVLAAERLEGEQADRMKLEKEKAELVARNRHLTNNADKLEMELMHSRAMEMSGHGGESDDDESSNSSLYKAKYERAVKELEYAKKKMSQQHEDDLEQLTALKKQLEKKLNDAYEEVDDQRQVVAQWKRKTQKIQGEMNDTRLHLEEQASRNSMLEKKQRKFDSELALANEDRRQEALGREKSQKEADLLKQDKLRLEDQVNRLTMDLEFRDDRITSLNRDLEDCGNGEGATEEEVRRLKREKMELELKVKDQEEELDDLAGQVQMLEGSRTKLEMEMVAGKKDLHNEIRMREEELEDARNSYSKKVKLLEQQLEQEHEERLGFLRERHEHEAKIMGLQDLLERAGDEDQISKLKRDLRRTKALLRDAQLMIEKAQNEGTNKVLVRQLKNQLEDAEFARTAAMKARQNAELELADTVVQLEDVSRAKSDLEERHLRQGREKADLASQMQESEEELQDVMRKYKASVAAVSTDQITIQDQAGSIQELEEERNKLREQLAELSQRVESLDHDNVSSLAAKRLEMKIREMESKLELELTTRGRLDTQIARLKEMIEKLTREGEDARMREQSSQDAQKKLARQLRELREDHTTLQGKEAEMQQKKNDLEKQLEVAEVEAATVKNDLKLAMKRIEDLQTAITGELDSESYSDPGSDSSDEDIAVSTRDLRRDVTLKREEEDESQV